MKNFNLVVVLFLFFSFQSSFGALNSPILSSLEGEVQDEQQPIALHEFDGYFDQEQNKTFILAENQSLRFILSEPLGFQFDKEHLAEQFDLYPYFLKRFYLEKAHAFIFKISNFGEVPVRIDLSKFLNIKLFESYPIGRTGILFRKALFYVSFLGEVGGIGTFLSSFFTSYSCLSGIGFLTFIFSFLTFKGNSFFLSLDTGINDRSDRILRDLSSVLDELEKYRKKSHLLQPNDSFYGIIFVKKEFEAEEEFDELMQEAVDQIVVKETF